MLTFLLLAIKHFLFFRYVNTLRSKIPLKKNFPLFNIVFNSSFSSTSPVFAMSKLEHEYENILVLARFEVVWQKFSKQHVKAFNGSSPVKKLFQIRMKKTNRSQL